MLELGRNTDFASRCLLSSSGDSAARFMVHLPGGGWCEDAASCTEYARLSHGTSTERFYPGSAGDDEDVDVLQIDGCDKYCPRMLLSGDAGRNRRFYEGWTVVILNYCDGTLWLSDVVEPLEAVDGGAPLRLRGRANMDAFIATLAEREGLLNAQEVVLGGASAGSLAAWLHADRWRAALPAEARFAVYADSPMWMDRDDAMWRQRRRAFAQAFRIGGALPKSCLQGAATEGAGDAEALAQCMLPQYFGAHIETPVFVLQSLYDPIHLVFSGLLMELHEAEAGADRRSAALWSWAQGVRLTLAELRRARPALGAFVHSCPAHGQLWPASTKAEAAGEVVRALVDGYDAYGAFAAWYEALVSRSVESSLAAAKVESALLLESVHPWGCCCCCGSDGLGSCGAEREAALCPAEMVARRPKA